MKQIHVPSTLLLVWFLFLLRSAMLFPQAAFFSPFLPVHCLSFLCWNPLNSTGLCLSFWDKDPNCSTGIKWPSLPDLSGLTIWHTFPIFPCPSHAKLLVSLSQVFWGGGGCGNRQLKGRLNSWPWVVWCRSLPQFSLICIYPHGSLMLRCAFFPKNKKETLPCVNACSELNKAALRNSQHLGHMVNLGILL